MTVFGKAANLVAVGRVSVILSHLLKEYVPTAVIDIDSMLPCPYPQGSATILAQTADMIRTYAARVGGIVGITNAPSRLRIEGNQPHVTGCEPEYAAAVFMYVINPRTDKQSTTVV